jgi:hypothetical protein
VARGEEGVSGVAGMGWKRKGVCPGGARVAGRGVSVNSGAVGVGSGEGTWARVVVNAGVVSVGVNAGVVSAGVVSAGVVSADRGVWVR